MAVHQNMINFYEEKKWCGLKVFNPRIKEALFYKDTYYNKKHVLLILHTPEASPDPAGWVGHLSPPTLVYGNAGTMLDGMITRSLVHLPSGLGDSCVPPPHMGPGTHSQPQIPRPRRGLAH